MIDRRTEKSGICEAQQELVHFSDTEIVLEFALAMTSLFPHLLKIDAHCYDSFGDIAESLYFNFVYMTLAGKYGVPVIDGEYHRFGFSLHCYRQITHIECKPKSYPVKINTETDVGLTEEDMKGKSLCLIEIGPEGIGLSGSVEKAELPEKIVFNCLGIAIVDEETGFRFRDPKFSGVYSHIDNWEFEFVPETYSKKEHGFFVDRYYEDL